MKKEELNMDKTFRNKLEGYTAEPPSHVWDNIQGHLAAQRKKRRLAYARWIAAAAVIILAFMAGWYFNEKSEKVIPEAVENQIPAPQKTTPQPENKMAQQENKQNNVNEGAGKTGNPALAAKKITSTLTEETVLVAAVDNLDVTIPENENSENAGTGSVQFENFSMNFLNSRKASFSVNLSEETLKQEQVTTVDQLSDAEKGLIAENAKILSEPSKKEGNWKMGLTVSPGYASQVTSHTQNYAQNMTYSGTEGIKNVSGGISVQYKTGKKWSIESGIYYAQNDQRSSNAPDVNYSSLVSGPAFDSEKSYFNTAVNMVDGQMAMNSTAGVIEFSGTPRGTEVATGVEDLYGGSNTLLTNSEFSQVFDFIEIPLYVRYNILDAKIGVQIMGGLNAGIIAGNNVFMENRFGTQNVGKTQDISTLNISGTVGFGLNYDISRRISMAVEPRLNYYLNSINQNPDVMFRPYRIGVYTGLYYQF